ncbi:hypothetical protein ACEXDP_004338 [Salmonella enterica]
MRIKQDLIELASNEEQELFVMQEYSEDRDGLKGCSMDSVALYFSHMFNIRFSKKYWESTLWPKLTEEKNNG